MATVTMGLVNVLDLMELGLSNGNITAVRNLLRDLRPQAVEIEKGADDFARLNWLESRARVDIQFDSHGLVAIKTEAGSGEPVVSLRSAIDKARGEGV